MRRATVGMLTVMLALLYVSPSVGAQMPPGGEHPSLILADVYRALDSASPRLEAARQMARAAKARIVTAGTLSDPQVQFGLMNRNLPGFGLQDPLGMTQVQVMQMVPIAGQLGLSTRVARARAGASTARAGDLAWELRSQAAMVFYELYQLDRSIEVADTTQILLRNIVVTARSMYSVGQGRQADVLRAQVEVDRMTEELARMRAMREAAAARLNALLDRPSDSPVPTPALPRFPREVALPDSLERLALAGRPMLAAGALDVEAAVAGQRRARAEIWPDLQLGAIYGQRPMAGGTDRMVSLMVGFSVPVWAGRRQLQMRREADAMRLGAEAELGAMRAETRGRVAELTATLRRSRTLRDLYRTTILPQAEATVASTLSGYQVGEVELLMLLDARMTVNRYRQQVFQLEAEEGTALAELEMLVGQALFDAGPAAPQGDER
ncbi:MAG TPA: TolC family protein [Gemmatimonadales bacterium]|nr:TolC family protein [Gemmatimonadales bacterium]